MSKGYFRFTVVVCAILAVGLIFTADASAKKRIIFGGGPAGASCAIAL